MGDYTTIGDLLGDVDPFSGKVGDGPITYYPELVQGSHEWIKARCGVLTASEMKHAVSSSLKISGGSQIQQHVYEIAAQRINQYVEPQFVSDDMERGHQDEPDALLVYHKNVAPIMPMGFVVNERWGVRMGYSPDGFVGMDGLVEAKSRKQRLQMQSIIKHMPAQSIPSEFLIQCHTGLMVAERKWLDFISFSGGMPMTVTRVYPDDEVAAAIREAAQFFEEKVLEATRQYLSSLNVPDVLHFPTERRDEDDDSMVVLD